METTRWEEDEPPKATPGVIQLFQPPRGDHLLSVDCFLAKILVDPIKAMLKRKEVLEILKEYPKPKRLKSGPSYLEVAQVLGAGHIDIKSALKLFAYGKIVGFWRIRLPRDVGISGTQAKDLVTKGFIVLHELNMEANT